MSAIKNSRKTFVVLFVLLFGTYAYFTNSPSPSLFNSNELVRFLLTKSMVRHHSVTIGRYNASGIDMALSNGRYYSGKAPGLSTAAVPFYALARAIAGDAIADSAALYIMRIFTVSLPAALFCLLVLRLVSRLGPPGGLSRLLTIGYGLGTMAFAYAVLFIAHQPAAILVFCVFLVLTRWKRGGMKSAALPLTAGLLAGLAVALEYPVALLAFVIAIFTFSPCRRASPITCFLLGLLPGIALILGYNWICFGNPLSFPYSHEAMPIAKKVQSTGLFGVALPSPYLFFMLLFSPFRGLFFVSPFLLLCIPGFFHLWEERDWRNLAGGTGEGQGSDPETAIGMSRARLFLLSLAAIICYLLFNSSYLAWSGGAAYGPRHLVPVIPFFLIPIAYLLGRHPREYRWPAFLLIAYSIFFNLVAVAGGPVAHEYLRNPVGESALLFVRTGNVLVNWGSLLGLRGLPSLAPLGILWLCCFIYLYIQGGPERREAVRRPLGSMGRLVRAATCLAGVCMIVLLFTHRTGETAYRHAVIGHGFDIRGDDARAEDYFKKSLTLDPRDPLVLRDYSLIALRRHDYRLALNLQMRLLKLSPGNRETLERIEIFFRLSEIDKQLKTGPADPSLLQEKLALEGHLLINR